MKRGFFLLKPAKQTAETSSSTKVTPTTTLKSIPSNRFHDVIISFMTKFVDTNSGLLLCSIIPTDPAVMETFLEINEDKVIPQEQLEQIIDIAGCSPFLAQLLATFLNLFLLDDEYREILLMDSEFR
ncbi:hypothetical protein RclHR1_32840001 [Rhizophagus clarus]|uniref:Uncharacterized protein n=1 Tax=Rhizophagus clarus TaxID=94130 RepID=A0A2Z6R8R3_9GLOM|nr:hypothetical protein RclHR1_32840001 [Rhizophagus clarus]GES86617.1 hypothetical protein RCL_e14758_RclHR1_32840001 [Rhizophagus clarus]